MSDFYERSTIIHQQLRGKIGIYNKIPIETQDDLSIAYTPGAPPVNDHEPSGNVPLMVTVVIVPLVKSAVNAALVSVPSSNVALPMP